MAKINGELIALLIIVFICPFLDCAIGSYPAGADNAHHRRTFFIFQFLSFFLEQFVSVIEFKYFRREGVRTSICEAHAWARLLLLLPSVSTFFL